MPIPVKVTIGDRYGRLVIEQQIPNMGERRAFLCKCDCGSPVKTTLQSLRSGNTSSCGCLRREMTAAKNFVHGEAKREGRGKEYGHWKGMRQRCNDPNHEKYPDYGGRGVRVCERWDSFDRFLEDMGRIPSPTHSIDRIDNDKGYEPSNCRWATASEQQRNRRGTKRITFNGESLTVVEWSERIGISANRIWHRLYRAGWSTERALMTPAKGAKQHADTA